MKSFMPRIEISLSQVKENTSVLSEFYARKGISLMGVSKAVLGEPAIVEAMIQGGVKFIADSRIENIKRVKNAGIIAQFVLLRSCLSRAKSTIKYADISLNTEIKILQKLSYYAKARNKNHNVIVMVEMGDLREGVPVNDLFPFIEKTLSLPFLEISGIAANWACYGGIKPSIEKMNILSDLGAAIEDKFHIKLGMISGGNSANYEWYRSVDDVGKINNLRLGESIFLGRESLGRKKILGLHANAFRIVAEVIEAKEKASVPQGEVCQDAFGNTPIFEDFGICRKVIVALGRQDVFLSSLSVNGQFNVLGANSDHLILSDKNRHLQVGDEVGFNVGYGGLLSAMTSPFITKKFI